MIMTVTRWGRGGGGAEESRGAKLTFKNVRPQLKFETSKERKRNFEVKRERERQVSVAALHQQTTYNCHANQINTDKNLVTSNKMARFFFFFPETTSL